MTIEVVGIGPEEVFCTPKQCTIEIDLRKSIDPPEAQPIAGELRTRQLKGGPVDPLPIAHPLYAVLGGADKGMRDQPLTEQVSLHHGGDLHGDRGRVGPPLLRQVKVTQDDLSSERRQEGKQREGKESSSDKHGGL